MAVMTHGSDLALAPTLGPLARSTGGDIRRAIKGIAEAGFRSVQLDATLAGLRPRELDASARRDLVSTLRRSGLGVSGVDFFIPADHYSDPAHMDRAIASAHAAIRFTADVGAAAVCLNLPLDGTDAQVLEGLLSAADELDTRLAIQQGAAPADGRDALARYDSGLMGAVVDPAELLLADEDPGVCVQQWAGHLAVARLSDAKRGQPDSGRCMVGRGDLDLMAYRALVDLAPNRTGPIVLDLRLLGDPWTGASKAAVAWQAAAIQM